MACRTRASFRIGSRRLNPIYASRVPAACSTNTLNAANSNSPLGILRGPHQTLVVETNKQLRRAAQFAPLIIATYNGAQFDAETGQLLGSYVADNPPAIADQTGYFLQSGTLRAVTLSSNTVAWSFAGDGMLEVRK